MEVVVGVFDGDIEAVVCVGGGGVEFREGRDGVDDGETCEQLGRDCIVDSKITRCWGVTSLTSNEGEGTVTVATRARWRVVSDDTDAGRVLLTSGEDGEVWNEDVEGAGEGRDVMLLMLLRDAPPWIKGNTFANAVSSLATLEKSNKLAI